MGFEPTLTPRQRDFFKNLLSCRKQCINYAPYETVLSKNYFCSQVNKPDIKSRTPLMAAAYNGHDRVVELLLGRSDVELGPNGEGETALYLAEIRGHAGAAELLR